MDVLILLLPLTNTVEPSQPVVELPQLTVEKPFHYIYKIGNLGSYYYITGIVINTGKNPVKHVRALIKTETFDGNEYVREALVFPSNLALGQKGVFVYQLGNPKDFNVGKYSIEPGSFTIDKEEKYNDLKLEKLNQEVKGGHIKSRARIINTGNKDAPLVSVEFAFFDAEGHVLDRAVELFPSLKARESRELSSVIAQKTESNPISSWEIQIDYG